MRARYIKLTIWVIALVVVWNLGQTYTVTNALFMFAAAGVVPGTDVALSPDAVMAVLAAVLSLALMLIFGTNITRGLRRLFARADTMQFAEHSLAAAQPVQVVAPLTTRPSMPVVEAAPAPAAVAVASPPVVVIALPRRPSKTLLLLRVVFGMVAMTLRAQTLWLRKHFPRALAAVLREIDSVRIGLRRIAKIIHRDCIRLAIFICRAAIRFWRWAEPYLRRFDSWLGIHFHRYLAAAKRTDAVKLGMHFGRETGKVFAGVREELRAVWSRVSEK
jgi:hypothetical protein